MWPSVLISLLHLLVFALAQPAPHSPKYFYLQDTVFGQYAVIRPSTEDGPIAFIEPSINSMTAQFHITNKFIITGNDQKGYAIESNSDLNPFGFKSANVQDLPMIAHCEIKNKMLECKAAGRIDFYICMNPANHLYIGKGKDIASRFTFLDCSPVQLRVVEA